MPRRTEKCWPDVQRQVLRWVEDIVTVKDEVDGIPVVDYKGFSYDDNSVSTLEVIERLSVVLEGHPPSLMLGVAASFFPEYYFQYSQNWKGPVSVIAVTKDGPKTLYQVAKEVCRADKQKLSCPKAYEDTLESLLPDCFDRPYILDVFQELLNDRKSYVFGYCGFISRVALLFRDEPGFLAKLNVFLASLPDSKLRVVILEMENGPSPALVFRPSNQAIQYVSKEGHQELLDRVEHHRSLWLQNCQ